MRISRRLLRVFTTLAAIMVLAGCKAPGGVLKTLPPPLVHTPRITPPRPLSPKAKPAAPTGVSLRGATIVIDAGHGGRDPGAWKGKGVVSRLPEKTIVLDIAKKLRRLLTERGANVVMTRTTDVFLELQDRAAIAERSRADLFVSIHADSAPRTGASGAEVYMYTQASPASQKAAHRMIAAFKRAGIHYRGIHRRNFHVLREHSRPAILVECGFLTNRSDARKLNTESYRTRIAGVIADGIADYFSQ